MKDRRIVWLLVLLVAISLVAMALVPFIFPVAAE